MMVNRVKMLGTPVAPTPRTAQMPRGATTPRKGEDFPGGPRAAGVPGRVRPWNQLGPRPWPFRYGHSNSADRNDCS